MKEIKLLAYRLMRAHFRMYKEKMGKNLRTVKEQAQIVNKDSWSVTCTFLKQLCRMDKLGNLRTFGAKFKVKQEEKKSQIKHDHPR